MPDSRTEIVIVAGVAVLLFLVWQRNRATQGSGLTLLPGTAASGTSNGGVPLSLTMPDGYTPGLTYDPGDYGGGTSIGGVTYSMASPNACGCGGNSTGGPTYGGVSDLAAALLQGGYDMPFVSPEHAF